jgi:hypothetical protein
LQVTVHGVPIKPALALGSWAAFLPVHGEVTVMGDVGTLDAESDDAAGEHIHDHQHPVSAQEDRFVAE